MKYQLDTLSRINRVMQRLGYIFDTLVVSLCPFETGTDSFIPRSHTNSAFWLADTVNVESKKPVKEETKDGYKTKDNLYCFYPCSIYLCIFTTTIVLILRSFLFVISYYIYIC